jgi:hypothetical protein
LSLPLFGGIENAGPPHPETQDPLQSSEGLPLHGEAGQPTQANGQPHPREEPPSTGELADATFSFQRKPLAPPPANHAVPPRSPAKRLKASKEGPTLFDFLRTASTEPEPELAAAEETAPAGAPTADANPRDASQRPAPAPRKRLADALVTPGGEKSKARDLLAAIRAVKQIEAQRRPATPEERQTLARFSGFGPVALSIFPDPVSDRYKDASWQELGDELRILLTVEEYESAKRATFNAFYTSSVVIRAMFQAIKRLGVPENALVLEPACGPGRFLYLAPPGMRFIGVELDQISGRIARALHPQADIRIENFRDTRLPEESIDAVIGNVPFADVKLEHRGQKYSLHDYFFAKSVDALRPGGVLALITSHFSLDKQNAAIREYLAERADFVGAIRLPSDAFKREGTSVVTDIVFLRKRAAGAPAGHTDPDWLAVAPLAIEGLEVAINRYFLNNPAMVLGTWTRKDTLYGEGYGVTANGELSAQLQVAIRQLPARAPLPASPRQEVAPATFTRPPAETQVSEGGFFIDEYRTICQSVGGKAVPVTYGGVKLTAYGTMTGKRFAALIRLRDRARRVLQSQNEGWPEKDRNEARRELNWAYDFFESRYGPINKTTFSQGEDGHVVRRMPNIVKFREDPDAMLVLSLEDYNEETGKATKAAIMKKDVVGKTPPVTYVRSAEEGLLVALNQRAVVDLPFIATLYGKSEEQIIEELGDLVFHDPESQSWQTADAYLSGNVRAKLVAAERAGSDYARNVAALRAAQPEDVLPGDIDANLGAPWIPESDIQAFAAELFRVESSSVPVAHLKKDAVWSLEADYSARQSVAAISEYGTTRANGTWLLELALNMKTPVVYDPDPADPDRRVVNQEATLAAREKQKQIKDKFRSWVFTDPDRTEHLVRLYNDQFNNLRPRLFDGSHLDFPGMNQTIQLRPHQKDAVWREMSSGNTLLAHAVGAGKTYTMAASGMKMRQAGLKARSTQMVFCDLGVRHTPWGYSVYEDITRKLVARGIPGKQIACVGEADSDVKKQALFEKVRSGQVRVLIGSTQKMGTGTNVQQRLVALHHLDAPWKPAEVEQREGRILRQGNENVEVAIYRYVTEQSFDAFMWQALETKARFIAQVIRGDNAARRAEDIGGQELSYAEVKAIASGNPAVLTLAEADAELQRLGLLRKQHLDEQYVARRRVRDLPGTIDTLAERLDNLTKDQATALANAEDVITIGGRLIPRDDVMEVLGKRLEDLSGNVPETRQVPLGTYRGLRFGLVLHPQFAPDLYLEGASTRLAMLSREHHGPRAVLNALERLTSGYEGECMRVRQDLAVAQSQLRDYRARLGAPFLHDTYLFELTALRDQLRAGLSGAAPEPRAEPLPKVSELAERIKALKAAHTIEGTPDRVGKPRSSAEEPVTARIHRRAEATLTETSGPVNVL